MCKFIIAQTEDALDIPVPSRATKGAAGYDLRANVFCNTIVNSKEIKLIPTGVKIIVPLGFEAQIRPRSGLALNNGITLLNTPGTIDSDYRGEIKLIMINVSDEPFTIQRGDRVAQMVFNKVETPEFTIVSAKEYEKHIEAGARGDGGFGHSGTV